MKKNKSPFWIIIIILLVIAGVFYVKKQNDNKPKTYNFDTSTKVGTLQQEIYDEYGIAVLYDIDVINDVIAKKVVNPEINTYNGVDYHISNFELLVEKLQLIKKCLSTYSEYAINNFTKEFYIVNDFAFNGNQVSGLVSRADEEPILTVFCLEPVDEHVFYHEMSHNLYYNDATLDRNLFDGISDTMRSTVSYYACTNESELFAEVLSFAVENKNSSVYTERISSYVDKITK